MADEKNASGLAAKMVAAMTEIGRVQKRGLNTAQNYNFVRSDDVAEAARAALAKYGIAIFADVLDDGIREIVIPPAKEGFAGKTLRVSRVRVAWTFVDSESGESRTVHTPGEGMDSGDKGIYKAMTGAMKYALMLGFLIPTGDADPEKAGEADEVAKDEAAAQGTTTAQKVKAKVTAQNGGARAPKDAEARKADVKARVQKLGYRGADVGAKIGEWLGRPVDGHTVFSEDDWLRLDVEILRAKEASEIHGRAQGISEQGLSN